MNSYQALWWEQAKSDYQVFELLRSEGLKPCHLLQHMQMVTEKLAKAYLWRSGSPPRKSHQGFVEFLRFLSQIRSVKGQARVANLFQYARFVEFQNCVRRILPTAYAIENLAPSLANDGPNPEYPWPHAEPATAPASYTFSVWHTLKDTSAGRDLMRVTRIAVERFAEYADL
jgi:hypothetical protein